MFKRIVMKKATLTEMVVALYIILFLYTGISKLLDFSIFKEQIATSPLLAPISKGIALSVPWIEFLAVILLIVPKWRLKGLYTSLLLMILFTMYIIGILIFNKELPCNCGGVISELSWTQHICFNSAFIAMGVIGILFERQLRKSNKNALSLINDTSHWSVQA
jgi:uncharacterized membrane protein YphA (DoxX/SURF4 family)